MAFYERRPVRGGGVQQKQTNHVKCMVKTWARMEGGRKIWTYFMNPTEKRRESVSVSKIIHPFELVV